MLKSKIHRATVTESNVEYAGSISIDSTLMVAADLIPFELVQVWNVTTGNRFGTYVIEALADSGTICINGAAAHLANAGDLVIIASFVQLSKDELTAFKPRLVFVDRHNRIAQVK
ncbi:aspartate 1-decarboxylase [bacterium]|nr:aspartate 1-decarboxylase [candidate division CSSED10-310 bacterium]